jgi:putative transposase
MCKPPPKWTTQKQRYRKGEVMKKGRFSESQMLGILNEVDAGMKVGDVCRKHGISTPTYYQWKSKYGGMDAGELKRMRELEGEHARLKRMYADLAMENQAMRELLEKNVRAWGIA